VQVIATPSSATLRTLGTRRRTRRRGGVPRAHRLRHRHQRRGAGRPTWSSAATATRCRSSPRRSKSSELIRRLTGWLEDQLAPHTLLHGVLVEVHGLGVLLHGKSGIGKSEAALDLIRAATAWSPTTWSRCARSVRATWSGAAPS